MGSGMNVAVDVYSDAMLDALIVQHELRIIFSESPWEVTQLDDETWCVNGVVTDTVDVVTALIEERVACNAQSFTIEDASGARYGGTVSYR